jgi:uncharacterized protein
MGWLFSFRAAKILFLPLTLTIDPNMKSMPLFGQTSAGFQLFLFLGIILLGTIVFMAISFVAAALIFNVPLASVPTLVNQTDTIIGLNVARFLQIGSQLGLFVFPPLFFAWLVSRFPINYLGFRADIKLNQLLPGLILLFAALPLIHALADLNKAMQLPEWLQSIEQWMLEKEDFAGILTERFLGVESIYLLLFNLLMIAVIPGIGEEMVFRSVLQPLLGKLFRNVHIGLVISAFLFAFMHMQFYGFLPRFVLGIFLGYAFLWSGSVWLPVMMHTLNNAAAVIVFYLHHNAWIQTDIESFGSASGNVYWLAGSLILTLVLLFIMWLGRSWNPKKIAHPQG